MTIDERLLHLLSDTVMYDDAVRFVGDFPALPKVSQLQGLIPFSRKWPDLISFVKNQEVRDWPESQQHYAEFYRALHRYLENPRDGLRQRIKNTLGLVPEGLTRGQERQLIDAWEQSLAAEFIQHLVADGLRKGAR